MCVYIYIYIHIYVCMYIYIYTHVCVSIYISLSMYIYICICIYVYICVYIYIYMYICMCVYIYIYIYIHTYTYIQHEQISEGRRLPRAAAPRGRLELHGAERRPCAVARLRGGRGDRGRCVLHRRLPPGLDGHASEALHEGSTVISPTMISNKTLTFRTNQ